MNREIKFRGKAVDNGEWVYGGYVHDIVNDSHRIIVANGMTVEYIAVDPETVGQFTGLPDKNEDEIYGGDIVKGYAPDSDKDEKFDAMVVEYVEDGFALVRPNPLRLYFHDLSSCTLNKSIEIIGNKHDNPELYPQDKNGIKSYNQDTKK